MEQDEAQRSHHQPDAREAPSQSQSDAEEVLPHMVQATNTEPHDSGYDSDHADALIRQLEAPSDDSDDENNSADAGGGVCIDATQRSREAVWQSLRYATFITGVHKFIHEKHRVQSYLAKELAKAEKEIAEDAGNEALERRFTDDGDIRMYTVKQQIKRRLNKKSPGFLSAVRMVWDAAKADMNRRLEALSAAAEPTSPLARGTVQEAIIDKAAFVDVMVKVAYLIITPPIDHATVKKIAKDDWVKDNGDDVETITYNRFVESMFQLVDTWTQTAESTEYDIVSTKIALGITEAVEDGVIADSTGEGDASQETGLKTLVGRGAIRLKEDAEIVYDASITKTPLLFEEFQNDRLKRGRSAAASEGDDIEASSVRIMHRKKQENYAASCDGGSDEDEEDEDEDGDPTSTSLVSRYAHSGRRARRNVALLSPEHVNAAIAKIYLSKMKVDAKLLKRDGYLCWIDKCRRKKDQRMDRFLLEYYIQQLGTKTLARRKVHHLCRSVTRLAPNHPRIKVFAELLGVPIMVRLKPYSEILKEFRPFVCSDFIIPMVKRLCPDLDKLDRWMGNCKTPTAVTTSDFMLAVKEICPHVPTESPVFVEFTLQVGMLTERLETHYRKKNIIKPNAGRPSIDLDEGLLVAMPVWTNEEEYLIMRLTLNAVGVLKRCMQRTRKHRTDTALKPGIYQRAKRNISSSSNNSSGGNGAKNATKKGDHLSGSMAKPDPILPKNPVSASTAASEAAASAEESINSNAPAAASRHQELSQALVETDSPRARQKLEEAKELDKKLAGNRVGLD